MDPNMAKASNGIYEASDAPLAQSPAESYTSLWKEPLGEWASE